MPTRMVPLTEIKGVLQIQETDIKSPDYLKVIRLEFINPGTQSRAAINQERVEAMAANFDKLPAIVLYDDGQWKWPGDGHHRISSAILTGTCPVCGNWFDDVAQHINDASKDKKHDGHKQHKEYAGPEPFKTHDKILADVRPGGLRDALLYSVGPANKDHDTAGMPRSRADKQTAVTILLTDPEWSKWTNQEIANRCFVSVRMVMRYAHLRPMSLDSNEPKTVTRGGKTYVMKTGKIGKKRRKSADEKLAGMTADEAKAAIEAAEQVCTCTCPACKNCKKKGKNA